METIPIRDFFIFDLLRVWTPTPVTTQIPATKTEGNWFPKVNEKLIASYDKLYGKQETSFFSFSILSLMWQLK